MMAARKVGNSVELLEKQTAALMVMMRAALMEHLTEIPLVEYWVVCLVQLLAVL